MSSAELGPAYHSEARSTDEDKDQTYETRQKRFDYHANGSQDNGVNIGLPCPLSPQADEH